MAAVLGLRRNHERVDGRQHPQAQHDLPALRPDHPAVMSRGHVMAVLGSTLAVVAGCSPSATCRPTNATLGQPSSPTARTAAAETAQPRHPYCRSRRQQPPNTLVSSARRTPPAARGRSAIPWRHLSRRLTPARATSTGCYGASRELGSTNTGQGQYDAGASDPPDRGVPFSPRASRSRRTSKSATAN